MHESVRFQRFFRKAVVLPPSGDGRNNGKNSGYNLMNLRVLYGEGLYPKHGKQLVYQRDRENNGSTDGS
jgi:hypothetical protein